MYLIRYLKNVINSLYKNFQNKNPIIALFIFMRKLLLLSFLICSITAATVSLANLQAFFDNTYDRNQDGHATLQ